MKRNSVRLAAVVAILSLAVLAGWQIQRQRAASKDAQKAIATGAGEQIADIDEHTRSDDGPKVLAAATADAAIVNEPIQEKPASEVAANPFAANALAKTNERRPESSAAPIEKDRYAAEDARPTPVEPTDEPEDAETPFIARGQNVGRDDYRPEVTSNPLRGADNIPPASAVAPTSVEASPMAREPSGLPAGVSNAAPIQSSGNIPVQPAAHDGRYGDEQSVAASPTPASPTPAAGFGGDFPDRPQFDARQSTPIEPRRNSAMDTAARPNAPYGAAPSNVAATPRSADMQGHTARDRTPMEPYPSQVHGGGRPGEQSLEGPQSPSLTIEKEAPEEIQVGKQCTFKIHVRNEGRSPAYDVRIHDEAPEGTELVGTIPRADQDADSRLVWTIETLAPGEERTVEMQLMPRDEGDLGSVATVTFASEASVRTRCTRPLLDVRATAGNQVMVGAEHVITLEVHNPGSGDATGVMLLENIPAGVSHPGGPSLEFEVGTLRAGETRKLELVLTAEEAGFVQNRIIARADANLEAENTIEFEVIAPSLQISVDGPSRRYLDRQATYTVAIENPGTAAAKDIELETKLPKGMQFVSANNLGEYDAATHSVHWSLAELPPKERGAVELVTLPVEAGEQRFQIASHASQGLQQETEHAVLVEGLAAIMFEVVDVDDPIEIGGETTYEIRVVNQGSKAATNVQVVAYLPPGMTALSASGPTQHQIGQGQVIFEALRQFAPKADTTFQVTVQGTQPGDQRFTVRVTTAEHQDPITKEESTRVYADE